MLRSDPEQALPSERRPRRCEDDNAVAWTGHARLLAGANPPGSGVLASGGAQAATLGAAPGLVRLARHPQVIEHRRQFPRDGDDRAFLGVLAAAGADTLAVAPQVALRTERPEDVVGALH